MPCFFELWVSFYDAIIVNKKEDEKMTEPKEKTSMGLDQNVAGLLCYLVGWVTGIIFLVLEKDNKFVKFHAIQSIIVFGSITIVGIIFSFIPSIIGGILSWLLWALGFILWIILMVKAYRGEKYKLPVAGAIAEKQVK
jgi:uncharacterized membrane protein